MNCDRAQAAISERMDGERLPGRITTAVDAHVEGCANCRTFAEQASRVRTTVRIRPAERIPDLVDPIMAEATARRQDWSATLGLKSRFGSEGPQTYAEVLEVLGEGSTHRGIEVTEDLKESDQA